MSVEHIPSDPGVSVLRVLFRGFGDSKSFGDLVESFLLMGLFDFVDSGTFNSLLGSFFLKAKWYVEFTGRGSGPHSIRKGS